MKKILFALVGVYVLFSFLGGGKSYVSHWVNPTGNVLGENAKHCTVRVAHSHVHDTPIMAKRSVCALYVRIVEEPVSVIVVTLDDDNDNTQVVIDDDDNNVPTHTPTPAPCKNKNSGKDNTPSECNAGKGQEKHEGGKNNNGKGKKN